MRRPSRRTSSAQARALSAYWDEVSVRAPADPVPPADLDRDLATTVRHLTAIPGGAAPDPRFADQLLNRIVAASQERTAMSTASAAPLSPMSAAPIPLATHGVIRERRWSAGFALAAVALIALLSAWAVALRDDGRSGRRDVTVVAAAGTSASVTTPTGGEATPPASANLTVGDGDNALFYTAVVDLTGSNGVAELWLVDVAPRGTLFPVAADSHLVMPLSGKLSQPETPLTLYGGQAVSFPGTAPWQLQNTSDATIRVLVLSLGAEQPPGANARSTVPPDAASIPTLGAVDLGPLVVDPSLGEALLEVSTAVGPNTQTWFDTGADGLAVILAESSPSNPAVVDVGAGAVSLIRAQADGSRGVPVALAEPDDHPTTVYLVGGDLVSIKDGAAASVRAQGDANLPILIITLRFDSARLQSIQSGGIAIPASTNAAGTPISPEGCGVGQYTAEELRALVATLAAGPLPSLNFGLADGEPADVWTTRNIETEADRLASCIRTNDPLRYSRLWSADGLRFRYSVRDLDEDLAMEVLPEDSPGMVDATVQDVRVHPDGRVSAVVDLGGEVAYVVWVKENGVYLVELFNDAIFAGPLAVGARCDTAPLDAASLAGATPEPLTPVAFPPGEGLDISEPLPVGTTPGSAPPDTAGLEIATAAVPRIFDCLSTLDPARVYPLATEAFRGQWVAVAGERWPLAAPESNPQTRLPLAIPTITSVETWEAGGGNHMGVVVVGESVAAYVVLTEVDGEWLVDGWAPL